ncbi:trigger factor [bacterium]|nr:trigger factor [bacterium]
MFLFYAFLRKGIAGHQYGGYSDATAFPLTFNHAGTHTVNILEKAQTGPVVSIRVEIPEKELEPHFEKAYQKARKTLNLDGFRPGKVPMSIVKKRYGEAIRYEALEDIIQKVYPDVLEETELRPLTPGDIKESNYQPGESLTFTVSVEIPPDFELADWRNLSFTEDRIEVTEQDIDRHLDHLRKDNAIISERLEDEGAENGDRVTADFQEVDEQGTVVIGSKQEDIHLTLGEGMIDKQAEEALLGIRPGETRRVTITEKHVDEASGEEHTHTIDFNVTAKTVENVELPELDDDFATMVDDSLETFDQLKEKVRDDLKQFGEYQAKQTTANRIMDALVRAHEFDVPPSLLEETIQRMVESRHEESGNMIPKEQIREQVKDTAKNQLKWYFIRDRLLDDLDLEVTDEDVDEALQKRADASGMDLESLKFMFGSGERRDQLERELLDSKLMDALHDGMQKEEQVVEFSSLFAR